MRRLRDFKARPVGCLLLPGLGVIPITCDSGFKTFSISSRSQRFAGSFSTLSCQYKLVPIDSPGVKIERMLPVFGSYDPPFGHGEVSFTNVRVPLDQVVAGPGRGFEIAQGRLGPGRIHHCMRTLGAAERALERLCRRSLQRVAFGKPLAELGANADVIANARIMLEQARLLTLKAAWMLDEVGTKGARSEISRIKVAVPNIALEIIDQAIQMHGGAGVSADFPLAEMFAAIRTLRIVDGPDEVHRALIARLELQKYKPKCGDSD
jgi:acyl-CoA dehydrogenase